MDLIERQSDVMNRSGLGFLPGITLAFIAALLIIAAIALETWWATFGAVAGVLAITGVMLWTLASMVNAGK